MCNGFDLLSNCAMSSKYDGITGCNTNNNTVKIVFTYVFYHTIIYYIIGVVKLYDWYKCSKLSTKKVS